MTDNRKESGVEALVERFDADLRAFLRRRVASADDADDLVQETWLRIASGLAHGQAPEHVLAWIKSVAKNVLVDHLRARSLPDALDDSVLAVEDADEDLTPLVAGWIESMLTEERDADTEAVELHELRGLSMAELAEREGLSVSGAKSRVQRGRAKLRARLAACCAIEVDADGRVTDYARRRRPDPGCCA